MPNKTRIIHNVQLGVGNPIKETKIKKNHISTLKHRYQSCPACYTKLNNSF